MAYNQRQEKSITSLLGQYCSIVLWKMTMSDPPTVRNPRMIKFNNFLKLFISSSSV